MMIPAGRKKWLVRALGAALAVVIMIGCAGSFARAEDDDDEAPDVQFFRGLLKGMGLRKGDESIDYRERSPLVVPPNRNLPPPVTTPVTEKNPAWPTDPETKARKELIARRASANRNGGEPVSTTYRVLRPDELQGKGNRSTAVSAGDNRYRDYNAALKPSELGYKGGLFGSLLGPGKEGEYGTFTGEAPRTSLIEPPVGYRTPSPAQPYGVGKEKWDAKPVDRLVPVR